ncbi:DUF3099 domain-containing protein [Streptomyces hoynatensis]|uniref:DUF3099 domain-containing protein n=1 Tax=Streptomyces hoynatensis TaxID=1141874 RepID=A0A3A9Z2J8_9ACTN|nr:DUF3099 domain-containing protein [Streptomyces hoynatensis]RKN42463.1 DUF3099 domain-containing protein [Streptomyces hoynatensis]
MKKPERHSARKGGPEPAVFRITEARQSLQDDVRGRQRRYVLSMLVRTAAVLLTVLLWNVSRPVAAVTLVVGAVLPYFAVVIANAGRENVSALPSGLLGTAHRALPPGGEELHKRS